MRSLKICLALLTFKISCRLSLYIGHFLTASIFCWVMLEAFQLAKSNPLIEKSRNTPKRSNIYAYLLFGYGKPKLMFGDF